MTKIIKAILKRTPLYRLVISVRQKRELWRWERNGKPAPPPHRFKQRVVKRYPKEYGLRVFIETGTYYGDMVDALKRDCDSIYSIELNELLWEKARCRFRREPHIELICGDSGKKLALVLEKLDRAAIFWLDGHYSGGVTSRGDKDSPIYEELNQILAAPDLGHIILIDDARCFGSDPAYPTIEELKHYVSSKRAGVSMTLEHDIIRIVPVR